MEQKESQPNGTDPSEWNDSRVEFDMNEDPIDSEEIEDRTDVPYTESAEYWKNEAQARYDQLLRSRADLENVTRRMEKEKADRAKFAVEDFARDLLAVLDSLDRALPLQTGELDPLSQGFLLVHKQLREVFSKHGVEPIKSNVGEPFNPNHHQAIARVEKDGIAGEVIEQEFVKGYLLHGRLLRAAMVSVAVERTSKE